ncbi:restriction endonuclease [Mucilaginibacter kameinonensis]|uniref:restriction endonuclease n=1 Tax=Mucilaginibacter kameinonensis TaxID=452286 RepID=UPI000EF801C1|nr:restriction endonuclease [Mucilaginibacter kameinonensis]
MIILGKNTDDKGHQLEELTKYILGHLGYEKVVTNEVGAGGDEIDVSARFRQPGVAKVIFHEVICECKAYKTPLGIPDWLKFLGKLYAKEHGQAKNIQGCFIALNGVNGNVHGHYKNLSNCGEGIQLIDGEDLLRALRAKDNILPVAELIMVAKSLTSKAVIQSEILYYQKVCYWLLVFSDESFTIFSADGRSLDARPAKMLADLVVQNTVYRNYVDLRAEETERLRMLSVVKYVLSILLVAKGPVDMKYMLSRKSIQEVRPVTGKISEEDIREAIGTISDAGIILAGNGKFTLRTHLRNGTIKHTLRFFELFLKESVILLVLGSPEYQELIDERFFKAVMKIQGDLKIKKAYYTDYISLMKWSPSALTGAIHPDPILVNSRKGGGQHDEQVNELGRSYLLQKMMERFAGDYKNQTLNKYFLKTLGIVELETTLNLKIKNNERLLISPSFNERLFLAPMTKGYKSVIIPVLLLPGMQEPWENKPPSEGTLADKVQ